MLKTDPDKARQGCSTAEIYSKSCRISETVTVTVYTLYLMTYVSIITDCYNYDSLFIGLRTSDYDNCD